MPKSYRPPADVARIARRALEIRAQQPPSKRAGTPVGVRRAAQLANREPVSVETLKRMISFFARHERSSGSAAARRNPTSKAAQAWGLWGGNAGRRWAANLLRTLDQYDD